MSQAITTAETTVPDVSQLVTDSTGNGASEMVGTFLKATCLPPSGPGTDWECD